MLSSFAVFHRLPLASWSPRIHLRKMSTTISPLIPKFVPVEENQINSRSDPNGFKFQLVSHNILAQVYVKSAVFPHSPSPCLKWKTRSQAVLTVLKGLGADFLCLQELDEYDAFYKRNIECHGYSSIYIQRSGQKRDGCGIFFKQDIAELVLEEKIEYNDLVSSVQDGNISDPDNNPVVTENHAAELEEGSVPRTSEDSGDPNDPRVRLKRDCVGIMGAFRLKASFDHFIIVANTHLYWDPEWADVKLAQAKYLLSRLAQFRTLVAERFECSPSVLLAGDFNSTPGDKVYQYLVSDHSSFKEQLECLEEPPIPLSSVYAFTKGEPAFTNCTPGFTGTLDYIFFCPSENIKPISFLEVPLSDSADVEGGLPNYFHPSDHLPIGAEFEVTKGAGCDVLVENSGDGPVNMQFRALTVFNFEKLV